MPTIAVIIPVYNRQQLCERAVRSVFNQQFTDFECVIVDDGSPDHVILPADLGDKRIRVIRNNSRCGVAYSRNVGVAATGAPLVSFLDSDDVWIPGKLQNQVDWLAHHQEFEIVQCHEQWIRNGIRVNPPVTHLKKGGMIFKESLDRCMITPSSVLLSRLIYIRYGMFNESYVACEDYDLWLRITAHLPVGLTNTTDLVRYGGHEDQLSGTVKVLDRFRIRSMLALLEHEPLTGEQNTLVRKQLEKKATIVANGYLKRGNREAYEQYQSIAAAARA